MDYPGPCEELLGSCVACVNASCVWVKGMCEDPNNIRGLRDGIYRAWKCPENREALFAELFGESLRSSTGEVVEGVVGKAAEEEGSFWPAAIAGFCGGFIVLATFVTAVYCAWKRRMKLSVPKESRETALFIIAEADTDVN